MPAVRSFQAKAVAVLKRSLRPGFAGEDNELFCDRKTRTVFGDVKDTLIQLVNLLKKR